jgi:hypothetical protein
VLAPCVVEPFDVVEHVGAAFLSGLVNPSAQAFGLQGGEEALHGGIILTVTAFARTAYDPSIGQHHLELLAGVLTALVRVVQDLARTATPVQDHYQRVVTD